MERQSCQICLDENDEIIIKPCKCRYVHRSCLDKWIHEKQKSSCEICGVTYQFHRIEQIILFKSVIDIFLFIVLPHFLLILVFYPFVALTTNEHYFLGYFIQIHLICFYIVGTEYTLKILSNRYFQSLFFFIQFHFINTSIYKLIICIIGFLVMYSDSKIYLAIFWNYRLMEMKKSQIINQTRNFDNFSYTKGDFKSVLLKQIIPIVLQQLKEYQIKNLEDSIHVLINYIETRF